jgi:UDP-N-acetylglucosamine 2-epimerase (non-hydrolysing)
MRILVPIGTRPEIVKLAPVVHLLRRGGFDVRVLATGQHDDPALAGVFFERFSISPQETWHPPIEESERVAHIIGQAFRELAERRPDCVLLVGDTYTVPLFCLAARRHCVPVVHIEAGLRSFNETSLEEVNRRIAGQTASLHLAPTETAARFLEHEGVKRNRIRVVGNPVIDALRMSGVRKRPPSQRSGIVLTAHRAGNVDNPERLRRLVDLILQLTAEFGPVTFPVHPRTRSRLVDSGDWSRLQGGAVRLFPPLPFDGMVELVATSKVVVSDSGGLQEEAAWLGVPVVVLRPSTPRWEGVAAGVATLTGMDVEKAIDEVRRFAGEDEQLRVASVPCPYGDGHTSQRVVEILSDPDTRGLLTLNAEDFVDRAIDVLPSGELLVGR